MKIRICVICKQEKSLTEFPKGKFYKDGHIWKCKKCRNEYNKLYRKQYRKKINDYHRKYCKLNPWVKALSLIQGRCNDKNNRYYKKGIKIFLTTIDLKYLWFRDKSYLMKQPSIHRIDNDRHYTLENCRYIEKRENCKQGGYIGRIKIGQYTMENKLIKIWDGVNITASKLGIWPMSISNCIIGRSKSGAGFIWKRI